ncbi:MAG: hypothetical protein IJA67_11220 [Oscillospiraceae bacterium]|nr:hypothetical protein [Oscillospiraceae bacterium]
MGKYPIKREFFPFSRFTPPISEKFLAMAVPNMKTPKFIFKDKTIDTVAHRVKSYDGEEIKAFLMSPKGMADNTAGLAGESGIYEGAVLGRHILLIHARKQKRSI